MKPRRSRRALAALATSILCSAGLASADTYSNDFNSYANGTTDLGDGTVFFGTAASIQGGRLQLTIDNQGLGFSSFSIPPLANSSLGWTASFDYEMFDAAGGNPPADGFSFNYGNAALGEQGGAEEGMTNRPGVTDNLSFEVDTWMNFDAEQGVNISGLQGGVDVGQIAFTNGPILNDGQLVSGTVTLGWDPVLGATFITTGLETNANFVNVDLGGAPGNDDWTFIFSARVGGANEDLFIDNLVITTAVAAVDTDGDGLSDTYENDNGLDPNDDGTIGETSPGAKDGPNGALGDLDGDGLSNIDERDNGTLPNNDDTDGDTLSDGEEAAGAGARPPTNPLLADSDADGLDDLVETNTGIFIDANNTGTNPIVADTDGDGLNDGQEVTGSANTAFGNAPTDPHNFDSDGDGVGDGAEVALGSDPNVSQAPPAGAFWDFEGFANGTTDLGDGTVIFGTSASIQNGQLELTIDGIGAGFSSFSVPPIAGSSGGWTATFDVTIIDSLGAQEPADGFSFNYGNAPLGTRGNAEEGIPAGEAPENLSFEIDTWMNIDAEQGVNISGNAGGVDVGQLAFNNGSILSDGSTVSASVTISYDPIRGATFITSGPLPGVAGTGFVTDADFINVGTGAFVADDEHTFIISARVGGANETVLIDNLRISVNMDDIDGDGLRDTWEDNHLPPGATNDDGSVNPDFGAAGDPDSDGLTNIEEQTLGTDPQVADTDGDGLEDGVEDGGGVYVNASQTGTNPKNDDTDGDGLLDGVEIPTETFIDANQPGTDPNNADTDSDLFGDLTDINLGQDPTVFDDPIAITDTYKPDFGVYADGTTFLNDGTVISGTAASIFRGQLRLTQDGIGAGFSSFSIPPLTNSSQGWTAVFDVTIIDGPGANPPADGFSLNYGDAAMGTLGSAEEGMGAEGAVIENISFEVDTWMNGDAEQGVNISEKVTGVNTDLAFTNGPILQDGTTVSGTVTISWNPTDGASFTTTGLDTNADFVNVATSFTPDNDHTFIISARVGGANETLLIDNLCITTRTIDRYEFVVSSPDNGITLDLSWNSSASEQYSIVSTSDPVANPDPGTWPVVSGLEIIAATPPLNTLNIPKPGDPLRLYMLLAGPPPPVLFEDFEVLPLPAWTVGANPGDSGTTAWEFGVPDPAVAFGPSSGFDGSLNCVGTNLGAVYTDNANIYLRSPDIDLTGAGVTGATLKYQQWRDTDVGNVDFGTVRILRSSDGVQLGADIDVMVGGADTFWESFSGDFPPEAAGEVVVIEWNFLSDAGGTAYSGWYLDSVEVNLK
jgi:hypothetical protein